MTSIRPKIRLAVRKSLRAVLTAKVRAAVYRKRRTIFGALAIALAAALVAATLTMSLIAMLAALVLVTLMLAGTLVEVRRAHIAHRSLRSRVIELEHHYVTFAVALYDQRRLGPGGGRLPAAMAPAIARALLDRGDALDAFAVIDGSRALATLDRSGLRTLRNELRRRGYLVKAREVARICVDRGGIAQDLHVLKHIAGEIAVLSGEFVPTLRPEQPGYQPRPGRILHVVGNSLPQTQSGYTLRTHYTAVAQREVGLDPHVVTQMGFGHEGDDYAKHDVDGITYHRIPGPTRAAAPLDAWMRTHIQRVANVVRVVRPAVLHAASDFVNAQTAEIVGKEFGIPVLYESRGFWEETWLSRQARTFGWDDLAFLEATHGLPDVYVWRREIEDRSRRQAEHVVTLADVMADRIEAGGVKRDRIAVIPNGVNADAFPVLHRNLTLAAQLGIDEDSTVIGYISSVVEYEGIDTLISAYGLVKASSPTPVSLLIVGDGAERERLMRQAKDLGLDDAIFTGRVGHDVVLDYYSLIDIFVVPRKPVEVCHLVTPLKPFEAFSTGRTVVLSNVRALAAIAEQSGAAQLFEAGDAHSLAAVLTALLADPQRRNELAAAGAAWVRTARTWAVNANAYLRLYEQMGAVPPGDSALMLLNRGHVLDAYALVSGGGSFAEFGVPALRQLRNELTRRGYLVKARNVAQACVDLGGLAQDLRARAQIDSDIAVLSGQFAPTVRPEDPGFQPHPGRVLHIVGKSLPHTQSGYTLRTHYTAIAQREAGLDPHVVTEMGVGHGGEDYAREELDGITYHRIPGPARRTEPFDAWMRRHVQRVANLVRVLRPAVLHAASDFINAQTALAVGEEFAVPVVYESRGFWEETWLSRQAQTFGWDDLARLEATHGLPDVYLWRRDIEDRSRRKADRVVTLADVMADRIEAGGVPRDRIAVIPNGVDIGAFPVLTRNGQLAAQLGIGEGTPVIGYISSLVEYEGIDTLIAAYAIAKASSPIPLALLIVGDGPDHERLTRQAATLGLDDAIFTGRVAHDAVQDYYSLIDIFVVPRKPVEVCHLVTPLKPFEAFSTGRAVVLSNVRALARVAEQSGAAEVFEAGDEQSLADVLGVLLKDPQRRADLATSGAAWVRAERTWAANAEAYIRLYQSMGAVMLDQSRISQLTVEHIDVDMFRQSIATREPIPLEVLDDYDAAGDADLIIHNGWSPDDQPAVKLDLPIDWTTLWTSNRTWNFRLHAWHFMGSVLQAHASTGERRYLDWCIDRAVSWAETFNEGDARGTMAWYDMALGARCHRLAYLVEQALTHGVEPGTVTTLLACVVRHQQELFADQAFNSRNNHGVYVALGELALARRLRALPGMDVLEQQGRARLEVMARGQFAADGGHLEHSPEYHEQLLAAFSGAVNARLIDSDGLRQRIALAEDVLGWFIQPNGELAQVGDSRALPVRSRAAVSSPTTDYILSRGVRGRPDDRQLLVLQDSGYAIVRSPSPGRTDKFDSTSYLLLAAGFHSRTHKHADDLTIIWVDRGREILIDAGRYGYVDLLPKDSPLRLQGYFYGAPERQYVESTRAHNTVEADGTDHVRRGREPYGSAIVDAEERDGHFRLRAQVDHGIWRHRRVIIFRPGQWLYVTDTATAQDDSAHDYRQWWNLPEDITPQPTEQDGLAISSPGWDEILWVAELGKASLIHPATAQHDPLRGWRSKFDSKFTPAWSTGYGITSVRDYEFRTLFFFGKRPPAGAMDHPFEL